VVVWVGKFTMVSTILYCGIYRRIYYGNLLW